MTPTETARAADHALSVAIEERRAHLVRCVANYRGWAESAVWAAGRTFWTALADEYAARLDELDRLRLTSQVASMECPADYRGGPGCTHVAVGR